MLRVSLRSIASHKGRFALTCFAVTLGVAFVVASFVTVDTLRASIDGLFDTIGSKVDVTVRAEAATDANSGFATRARLPEALEAEVASVDGVAVAEGSASGYAQMVDKDGEPVTTNGAPFLGVSWGDHPEMYPATMSEGRAPKGPNEVAIDADTSTEFDLDIGDTTSVLLTNGPREVTIVGLMTFGDRNSLLGARLTAFDRAVAQEVFDAPGEYDQIDVLADDGVDPDELAARIDAGLPDGIEALTSEETSDQQSSSTDDFVNIFQTVLLAFAGISIFVSAYLINNTFAIILGQRTRELSLLRGLGASSGQVRWGVTVEALAIGVLASAIGIPVGMALSNVLAKVLEQIGFEFGDTERVLAGRTLFAALTIGVVVTVAATFLPARRAAQIPPVEGMSDGYHLPTGSRRRRALVGGAATALGVGALGLGLFALEGGTAISSALGVGAVATLLGISMLAPFITPWLGRLISAPFSRLGVSSSLASRNVARTPLRTARTASALMIGLTLVTMVLVVGTSIKAKVRDTISGSVRAELVATGPGFTGFSPDVTETIRAADGVRAVSGIRFDRVRFDNEPRDVIAMDSGALDQVLDIDVDEGDIADFKPGTFLLHVDDAKDLDLRPGDTVELEFAAGGPHEATLAATFNDATIVGNLVIPMEDFVEGYPVNDVDFQAYARLDDSSDVTSVTRRLEKALSAYPQVELNDQSEFLEDQEAQIDGFLAAINGLLLLALFIALMGIANTLGLSVLEREREIGLLRAVGMARRQTSRMIRTEAVTTSLIGALLGVATGALFGAAATIALPDSAAGAVAIPWGSLIGVVLVSTFCGLLAGLLPARRAARMPVLEAITGR